MINSESHQCFIYEGLPGPSLRRLVPLYLKKIQDGHRSLFLGYPAMVSEMQAALAAAGLDVSDNLRKGSLVFVSEQRHLQNGRFDPDGMVAMWVDLLAQALRDGYKGLFAAGDMTWEFETQENLPKLMEYECKVETLFRAQPALSAVCLYHKDTLPLEIIGNAFCTHQSIFINETRSEANSFFVENFDYKRYSGPRPDEINWMLQNISV